MTPILTVALVVAAVVIGPLLLLAWDAWKARRFDAHVATVIDIFDDGKALVRETEEHLRELAR